MIKGNKKNNYRNIFDSAISTSALRNKTYQIKGAKILKLLLADVYKSMNKRDTIPLFILYNGHICRQRRILEIEIELWTLQPGSHFLSSTLKPLPLI